MSSSISPLRRLAVTSAMIGAAVFGSVALAPAASADESAPVVEQAPAPESAPIVEPAPEVVPATEVVPVPEVVPAPPAAQAPAVEQAPAPAPVVTEPPIAYDKNGKPIKPPKACTAKELEKAQKDAAQQLRLADSLADAAAKLRQAADQLHAQAAKAKGLQARVISALATASDRAAELLEDRVAGIVDAASVLPCIPEGGGRF